MANEHIEANCLNKSLLLKVNSSKEDEEYISTLHQRIQPVRAATHNKFKTKSNKSKSKNNNNWCAANIQQRQQQQQQFQYHQINTAGCVVVDNNNRVVDTNSLLKAPSFSNDIVRLSSNSYVMLHQLQQSRANIKKQQAMNKRMSRQTRMNLLCDVDSLKEQQRDTSPSSLSTSTTSSGIDTMNKSSTDSENGCFQYVPPVNNCACEICAINDDKRWLNNNYANYYVQQAAQNHWYGCYQSTALTTAICAARHAVAYQQLCRQQKNLCDGCCYTNTYSNQTNPSTNTNSTDIQFQCNASNLDSTNIPLHENCCDNHRLPISTYGNYFMIPYEIIEPYLRFLESLYPQTIQKSQSNVDNENDHLLPPSFHPEMAQLSKPSSLPVLVNKTTSFATPYHMQYNRDEEEKQTKNNKIHQQSSQNARNCVNQKITPNDCDEDNVDQRSNNTISTSSFRANQHVDRASKSDNNEVAARRVYAEENDEVSVVNTTAQHCHAQQHASLAKQSSSGLNNNETHSRGSSQDRFVAVAENTVQENDSPNVPSEKKTTSELFVGSFSEDDNVAPKPLRPPPASSFNKNGRFEVSKMDVLSEEIWDFHNTITQSEGLLNRKLHLRDMLYYCISPVFPMCGLYVVGSSLNGFGNNSSDMDLCLMISHRDIDQRSDAVVVLGMIKSALESVSLVRKQQLIVAKVPILRIRFTEPFDDITVDLNANNSVAIRNTHLLCYYSSFDWRVRPLVSVVKEWAKRKDINDANRSTFTSYSLVLMVIHYLQCGATPAVLPSLQEIYPKRFNCRIDVRTLNVSIPLEPPANGEWQFCEGNTLGELLIGFLEYYAFKFDYVHDAISVRLGSKIERSFVARQRSPYNNSIAQWNCICIEEPFTLSNTAHSVHSQMVFDAIKEAFIEGFEELDSNRDLNAFLNAAPIKIGANIASNGSSSHLSMLSVMSTEHSGNDMNYDRMIDRHQNSTAPSSLFLVDSTTSESSGHSSIDSSPRSTPINIEEQSSITSNESIDGDVMRQDVKRAFDQDSYASRVQFQREGKRLDMIPAEKVTINRRVQMIADVDRERDTTERYDGDKASKWTKPNGDSLQHRNKHQQQPHQNQQTYGRRRKNGAGKLRQTLNGDVLSTSTYCANDTLSNKKSFSLGVL